VPELRPPAGAGRAQRGARGQEVLRGGGHLGARLERVRQRAAALHGVVHGQQVLHDAHLRRLLRRERLLRLRAPAPDLLYGAGSPASGTSACSRTMHPA